MPMTRFAAMGRTDHSMRPPTPATTMAFKSPNACNLCHGDHDAAWADGWVRKWYPRDYQAEVLRRAELVHLARQRQWKRLPEILADLQNKCDAVYKTLLVRLLRACEDGSKWPVLLKLLQDPSPLVRSSAASALGDHLTPEVISGLLSAAGDPLRLVRIRTAMSLAAIAPQTLATDRDRASLQRANLDFTTAMEARPDDWASHANLGNFYMERRDFPAAAACFETAAKLEPRAIGPLVNIAMAYSNMDQLDKAEKSLRPHWRSNRITRPPTSISACSWVNKVMSRKRNSRCAAALKADPQMAAAAYNLGVLLASTNLEEALTWCQKAHDLRPGDPKYAHTLAFYQHQKGNSSGAIELLRQVIRQDPQYLDAYVLLGRIYEERHDLPAAAAVYRACAETALAAAAAAAATGGHAGRNWLSIRCVEGHAGFDKNPFTRGSS